MSQSIILLADAGPFITLAYADALDALLLPRWQVQMVDMVLNEVTRNLTPSSEKIASWVKQHNIKVEKTQVYQRYQAALGEGKTPRKNHLGELAIQEVMTDFALQIPAPQGLFLFEDHKIAKTSFILPDNCQKISTRAFLRFLEQQGWIASALAIEQRAIQTGRAFSRLRFPSEGEI